MISCFCRFLIGVFILAVGAFFAGIGAAATSKINFDLGFGIMRLVL